MTNHIKGFWQSLGSNDPFDALFQAAPILLHSVDDQGRYLRISQYWADHLGYSVAELLGKPMLDFLTPESRVYAKEIAIPAFRKYGNATDIEYDFVCKNGDILPIVMAAIAEYDNGGTFVRSLAISFDNSNARKIAKELQRKHSKDAIGDLVGGVAHDFNNLLSVIQGNLQFLRQETDPAEREDLITAAVAAADRGNSLIEQLVSFGRQAQLSPKVIDVNGVVDKVMHLVTRLFPSNIEIEVIRGDSLWPSQADAALMETAVLNVMNNARDSMPMGGKITMETRNVDITPSSPALSDDNLEPGRYVMLSVSDTGHGMDERLLQKVFKPFFTTKPQSGGSGLGLSMVQGFVRQSKGAIRLESKLGTGTRFSIYVPVEPIDQSPLNTARMTKQALEQDKKVLIVEDDISVRRVLARHLRGENIEIFEAESGDNAFRDMESGLRPDLLLTDVVMPGIIQGPELAQKARALFPDMRVLFMSGYPVGMSHHAEDIAPTDRQLIKPVTQDKLLSTVVELLVEP